MKIVTARIKPTLVGISSSEFFSSLAILTLAFLLPVTFVRPVAAQSVPNDSCTTAIDITAVPFSDTQNTRNATDDPNDPVLSCANGGGGKTVWYQFTPQTDIFVRASTRGSTPEDYDTALGLFTGTCDNLVEVDCNDDIVSGLIRQSVLTFMAQAGVTYFIHVAEWNGGGPNGGVPTGGDLLFTLEEVTLFEGPESGSIAGGDSVSTDAFTSTTTAFKDMAKATKRLQFLNALKEVQPRHRTRPTIAPTGPVGSNFVEDPAVESKKLNAPVLQKGFQGVPDPGLFIPPDPIMAVGPEHVVALVNSQMGIFDKQSGSVLKLIDIDEWFANVHANGGPFDPQIVYDHQSNRWIMVWVDFTDNPPESFLLLSVSDDSNPLGVWCNWNIPGNQNGGTANTNFNDFPKLGVDQDAVYVTANEFDLPTGEFKYTQVRIIPKAQLLDNLCGPVTWTDFWNLRNPSDLATPAFTTVPAVTFGSPGVEYLVDVDFVNDPGTFMNLWTLSGVMSGAPTLDAVSVPVAAFESPPNADQLGGSETLIDVGGRRNRNVVYRDGSVWTAHSVADTTGQFARARYVRIDVNSQTLLEDVAFGKDNFWYSYPAITPDANGNMIMAFTRGGLTEYASARYTGRLATDPAGLQASALLKAGEDNYVKTFGQGRNRWGDYNGIALDPSDGSRVWMLVEYAAQSAGNGPTDDRWGTWIGSASFVPLSGPSISVDPQEIDFGTDFFASAGSLGVLVMIFNNGDQPLTINSISLGNSSGPFSLNDLPALPTAVPTFGETEFKVMYDPSAAVMAQDIITISSSDPNHPAVTVSVTGISPPKIQLDAEVLDVTVESGRTAQSMLTISNAGGLDLEFKIGLTGVATFLPVPTGATESVSLRVNPRIPSDLTRVHRGGSDATRVEFTNLTAGLAKNGDVQPGTDLDLAEVAPDAGTPGLIGTLAEVNASPNTLFQYNVSTEAGETLALGVEFDGTSFWVTGAGSTDAGDANRLFQYDVNGALVNTFDQGTTSTFGWRDLAFDGAFLYASDSPTIEQIDPATGAVTGVTILGPLDPNRALAYDPATDHFWVANFSSNIFEIDRSGKVIRTFSNSRNVFGLGWDGSNPNQPYLWAWSQDGNGALASQFDPIAGQYTGLTFDGLPLTGGGNNAGGATITTALPTDPPNIPVLVGLHQGLPDQIVGYLLPPAWITAVTPDTGTVAENGSQSVQVDLDALGLAPGNFSAGLVVGSNDLDSSRTVVDMHLTVTEFAGKQIRVEPSAIDFSSVDLGDTSEVATVRIHSIGNQVLTIFDVADPGAHFSLSGLSDVPGVVPTGTFVEFGVAFNPNQAGAINGSIVISSDDADDAAVSVELTGTGFDASPAQPGVLYGSTGNADGGRLLTIDPATGIGTVVDSTGFPRVQGLAINSRGEIFGSFGNGGDTGSGSRLIKINAATGSAIEVGVMRPDFVESLAFDGNDVLYGADSFPGDSLYVIDGNTADVTAVGSIGVALTGLSFSPEGLLFGSTGRGADSLYAVDTNTGVATLIAGTGIGGSIPDIAFDGQGNLFGVSGRQGSNPGSLFAIDPATGNATLIGTIGVVSVSGLAFAPDVIDAVKDPTTAASGPVEFSLEQNYPNPFNPSTKIRYTVAEKGQVSLTIYNLLGQPVRQLVDKVQDARAYEVVWDGKNDAGIPQSSGVYLYRLKAGTKVQSKKMLFIK